MENTLLFGNGLNTKSPGYIRWDVLLSGLKGKKKFEDGNLPNTMIYERILLEKPKTGNKILENEFVLKKGIANKFHDIETNSLYHEIFELKFKNYLTTNYDEAFIKEVKKLEMSYQKSRIEKLYSIRRNTSILDKGKNEICKLWNIHGEIGAPATIMLGYDHYCGYIGKVGDYIKGNYTYGKDKVEIKVDPISKKLKSNAWDNLSWIELFFNSNIHILGISLDYCETELWWVLNKRARMSNDPETKDLIKNKIYFYVNDIEKEKEGLFKSFNVEVVKIRLLNNDWVNFYKEAINKIKANSN